MKIIRHRVYRPEIITGLWLSSILLFLGAGMLDGGVCASIALIAGLSFWIGAIRPIIRKKEIKSDRLYLRYGYIGVLFLAAFIAPAIWIYRGKF